VEQSYPGLRNFFFVQAHAVKTINVDVQQLVMELATESAHFISFQKCELITFTSVRSLPVVDFEIGFSYFVFKNF
jgi:hypothetical protein